jgi:Uma2 family endonuclease
MPGNSVTSECLQQRMRERHLGAGCQVVSSDLRVKVSATGLYTYPDVAVVCGKPELERPGDTLPSLGRRDARQPRLRVCC